MHADLFQSMTQSIIDGDSDVAAQLAQEAIDLGVDPLEAINQGFVVGVDYVGNQFSCGDAFLPELVMAGEAMKAALKVLEPEMEKSGARRQVHGKVVLATVEGDIHDIGKSMVGTMLSAGGFEVIDLGVDIQTQTIVEKARQLDADIVAVSSLLTTTMARQKEVVGAIEDLGLRSQIKIMVGGAPVTRDWADEIGADGYSEDAVGAVNLAKQLVQA